MSSSQFKDHIARWKLGTIFEKYLKRAEEGRKPVNQKTLLLIKRVLERVEDPYSLVFTATNQNYSNDRVFRELVLLNKINRDPILKGVESTAA